MLKVIYANKALATAFIVIIIAGAIFNPSFMVIFNQFCSAFNTPIFNLLSSLVPNSTYIHPPSIK